MIAGIHLEDFQLGQEGVVFLGPRPQTDGTRCFLLRLDCEGRHKPGLPFTEEEIKFLAAHHHELLAASSAAVEPIAFRWIENGLTKSEPNRLCGRE